MSNDKPRRALNPRFNEVQAAIAAGRITSAEAKVLLSMHKNGCMGRELYQTSCKCGAEKAYFPREN